jgi:hypothetical protein
MTVARIGPQRGGQRSGRIRAARALKPRFATRPVADRPPPFPVRRKDLSVSE